MKMTEGERNKHLHHNCSLVLLDVLLALDVSGLGTDLLVILLEGGKILTRLGELTLLRNDSS